MLRQKISSEWLPHRTIGRVQAERRNIARGGTQRATSTNSAKNEMRRIGARLLLLTGHSCAQEQRWEVFVESVKHPTQANGQRQRWR